VDEENIRVLNKEKELAELKSRFVDDPTSFCNSIVHNLSSGILNITATNGLKRKNQLAYQAVSNR